MASRFDWSRDVSADPKEAPAFQLGYAAQDAETLEERARDLATGARVMTQRRLVKELMQDGLHEEEAESLAHETLIEREEWLYTHILAALNDQFEREQPSV